MSSIRLTETGSNPTDSPDGTTQLYAKTDGKLYIKREENTAVTIDDSSVGKGKVGQVVYEHTSSGTDFNTFSSPSSSSPGITL